MSPAIASKPLLDKIAIVTGGGQGLGQALCFRLAEEGAHVVVADINNETAKETAAAIRERTDRQALAIPVNVTDEAQVEAMVQRTVDEFGRLDILVANAGVLRAGPVEEFDAEAWRFVMNVNLFGYFVCLKHAARVMKAQGSGAIVQINSKSGKKGSFKNSAYAASKFAKRFGITEEEVRQRYIDQVPMKRGCTYDDVASLVVFLASDQSSYMTGQAVNVTGGQEMK